MGPVYIPILKGKPGEFGALRTLRFSIRSEIIPLVEITPPPTKKAKAGPVKQTTLERRMKEQAVAIKKAWPVIGLPLFIDTQHLLSAAAIGLTSLFKQLSLTEKEDESVTAIPVTGPDRSVEYQTSVSNIINDQRRGVCYRIPSSFLNHKVASQLLKFLQSTRLTPQDIDVVLDMGYLPNESADEEKLLMIICGWLSILPNLAMWRTVAVAGSSFPVNLSDLKSRINTISRSEWNLWSSLSQLQAVSRIPIFADYAIQHPALPPSGFKGTANIRYTTENNWLVFKGSVLDERDPRTSGVAQFKTLAREVAQHPAYCERDFSAGDEYIHDCATWETPSGQPMKWREVGTNHHITYVVNQLASAHESLKQA